MGEAFRLVPELFARELTAIGYKLEGERLTLACAEPIDVAQQREISAFLGVEVDRMRAWPTLSPSSIS